MTSVTDVSPARPAFRLTRSFHGLERLAVPALLIAGWEAFARSGMLPPALLPAPSAVLHALGDWVFGFDETTQTYSGHWLRDALASALRVFGGFALASLLGILAGVAIGWSRLFEKTLEPTLQMLRPIPPVSWIPLAIIWFGIADKPAIFLVFLGAFFPVLMNSIHGVKTVDHNLVRAGAMMGANGRQMLTDIVLPAALPSIFAGLRIAVGGHGRRLCLGDARGGGRRQHHGAAFRASGEGHVAAHLRRELPQARRGRVLYRRRLSPDHFRSDRRRARAGTAGAGQGRLHLVQGVHDL
ncbi:ABC transporter permease [Bradyrhizobium sp. LMG 9283]|uniref:ABC transporter permease n=1 Tax=Bradyrhizobium sp. LMG 9283 TaxID=592064 RepID=UPI00388D372F